jgi:quinol monooxygenase YgiN
MRSILRLVLLALAMGGYPATLDAQGDATLYLVRYIEARPASQMQVGALLKQLADASRADGPVRFEALQSASQPNQFLTLEIWKDQQALDAHAAAAHTKQFRERVAPLLLAPVDDRLCIATFVAPPRGGRGASYVVTHVDVPGTNRDATLVALQALAQRTRNEPGNIRFDVVHQKDRTNHFSVIGVWSNPQSDLSHQGAPHTLSFRTTVTPMLGALYDQRWYRPL